MTTRSPELVTELNTLLRLTRLEAAIAQTRVSQAATPTVAKELGSNADNARSRAVKLAAAVQGLGGVPDRVGSAVGQVAAAVRLPFEQGLPLSEALLSDLALEQQLRDRAQFAREIAQQAGDKKVTKLLSDLEHAHTKTVEWLHTNLAQVAIGGPAMLRPTPVQRAAGLARRASTLATASTVSVVNRVAEQLDGSVDAVRHEAVGRYNQVRAAVRGTASAAGDVAKDAGSVLQAGRDAALAQAEDVAREDGATDTARSIHKSRAELGSLSAEELPIGQYDTLSVKDTVEQVKALKKAEQVRSVLAYEEAHRDSVRVNEAARERIAELAGTLASA